MHQRDVSLDLPPAGPTIWAMAERRVKARQVAATAGQPRVLPLRPLPRMSGTTEVCMSSIRVAIAGLGAIGRALARRLAAGAQETGAPAGVAGVTLACAAARDRAKAQAWLDQHGIACPLVDLDAFPRHADLAVECAPAGALEDICRPMLQAGKRVMVLSAALLGLDAVSAAAEGTIHSVRMVTRKPPGGLAGAPYLVKHKISVEGLNAAKCIFRGSAREAAVGFPENVNVVAALSLAGIGPDRTTIEIWADPAVSRNCHNIEVDADSARFSLAIENIPSENPKTGRITALSALAALRKLTAPLRVGT